jgi:hypothetical protein
MRRDKKWVFEKGSCDNRREQNWFWVLPDGGFGISGAETSVLAVLKRRY